MGTKKKVVAKPKKSLADVIDAAIKTSIDEYQVENIIENLAYSKEMKAYVRERVKVVLGNG